MRNFIFAAVTAALIFLAAGCGGGGSGGGVSPPAGPATGTDTVTWSAGTLQVETQAVGDLRTLEIFPDPAIFGLYGTEIRRVTYTPLPGRLVYTSAVGGILQLFVSEPDGTRSRQITTGGSECTRPRFSPDGGRIAFISDGALWVMNSDGSRRRTIPTPQFTIVDSPVWTPSGTSIVVRATVCGQEDLWRVDASSGTLTQLTNTPQKERDPDFTGGGKIVYARENADWDIWIMDDNGANQRPLVTMTGDQVRPRWAPDNTGLAFASNRGGDWEIWTARADGQGARRLTNFSGVDTFPCWSPDGSKIRWIHASTELWEMNANGTGQQLVKAGVNSAADWWGPSSDRARTFVGPAGSDWSGYNPPFGTSRYFIIITTGTYGTSAITAGVACGANGSNVTLAIPQGNMYLHTAVAELRAPCITVVYEDNGPGVPPTSYDMPQTDGNYPQGLLMSFNYDTGRLVAIMPLAVSTTTAAASSAARARVERNGNLLVVRGLFIGVFTPEDPAHNLAPEGARAVALDPAAGKVVSIQ